MFVLHVAEDKDGRLVIGGEQAGSDRLDWLRRLAAAVERELAGEELGLPGLCPAALGVTPSK